jgi:hypothetical protein
MAFKLSKNTITALKNFSSINLNIVFEPGQSIQTIAEAKNILASYNLTGEEEVIPQKFGIYDLPEFLSVLAMFNEPMLTISDTGKYATITSEGSKRKVKYHFASPSLLTVPPAGGVKMPAPDIKFDLPNILLQDIKKAGSTLGLDQLVITRVAGGNVVAKVCDIKDNTSNVFEVDLGEVESSIDAFEVIFNISHMKVVPHDYSVGVSSKGISTFDAVGTEESSITYWIAVEKQSTFK